jgi:hypothetical protein
VVKPGDGSTGDDVDAVVAALAEGGEMHFAFGPTAILQNCSGKSIWSQSHDHELQRQHCKNLQRN